jgi:hypothetical protein
LATGTHTMGKLNSDMFWKTMVPVKKAMTSLTLGL